MLPKSMITSSRQSQKLLNIFDYDLVVYIMVICIKK